MKRIQIYLLLVTAVFGANNDKILAKVKNLRCDHVNPKIYDGKVNCSIKPTRDGNGVTNVRYTYGKPANDIWAQVKLFYKFPSGTQFRPWMIDFDVDVCDNVKQIEKLGGFVIFFANSLLKNAPTLLHSCPYIGEEGLKDGNINAIMGDSFPQVIPKGTYKLQMRFHLKNNDTFFNIWITAEIDAQDPMKAISMGK